MGIVFTTRAELRVGPLAVEKKGGEMRLRLHDSSVVLLVMRKEGRKRSHQIQGIAIGNSFEEAERQANAICRDWTYYWVGPVPANCALPHTAFHLERHYPLERRATPRRKNSPKSATERAGRSGRKGMKALKPSTETA